MEPLSYINVGNERSVPVPTRIYPMLMEWDWQYDPETEQTIRMDGDRKVFLYAEQLRYHRNDPFLPVLQRAAIRGLFGHLDAYREMLLLSQRQREVALWELNVQLPSVSDVIAHTLASGLVRYWDWKERGERWIFRPDMDKLTPGTLDRAAISDVKYTNLGDFMELELTGDWASDSRAPTGLSPENMFTVVFAEGRRRWRDLYKDANPYPGAKRAKITETYLRGQDMPVPELIDYAMDIICYYPLP